MLTRGTGLTATVKFASTGDGRTVEFEAEALAMPASVVPWYADVGRGNETLKVNFAVANARVSVTVSVSGLVSVFVWVAIGVGVPAPAPAPAFAFAFVSVSVAVSVFGAGIIGNETGKVYGAAWTSEGRYAAADAACVFPPMEFPTSFSCPTPAPFPLSLSFPVPGPGSAVAVVPADHALTSLCISAIAESQGTVSVVVSPSPPSLPPGITTTVVVVMGTSATGISVHPQCISVTVVVRHVGVGVGQVRGCIAQMVVYVVEMVVGWSVTEPRPELELVVEDSGNGDVFEVGDAVDVAVVDVVNGFASCVIVEV